MTATRDRAGVGWILPVLFLEFLAIAITKSLLPEKLNAFFGDRVYVWLGAGETAKGLLAFLACPALGRLSDGIGRRPCLVFTVLGTTAPCWVLAFTNDLRIYIGALALSGVAAATFTLVFAYLSDVTAPRDRAAAYGSALATLGLSFTIGPPLGALLARRVGDRRVFLVSLFIGLFATCVVGGALPESLPRERRKHDKTYFDPRRTFRLLRQDLYLRRVAGVVLCYYSGVWALVTTLVVYAVRVFGLNSVQVGYLLSLYGLCTMVSESIIVRYAVPALGELRTARLGLVAFAAQCGVVAFATSPTPLYASVALSLVSNLVYPALSALVARRTRQDDVGEALGAMNGVKALTEGLGPLAFSLIIVEFERTALPGLPYLACAALSLFAWALSHRLPEDAEAEVDVELVGLLASEDEGIRAEDASRLETRRLQALVGGYKVPLTLSAAAFAPAPLARNPSSAEIDVLWPVDAVVAEQRRGSEAPGAPEREVPPAA